MQEHIFGLKPIYYDLMKQKIKTLEGRLNDEKRQKYKIGDILKIYKEPEREEFFKAKILDKFFFKNFEEMASVMDLKALGFEGKSKEDVIEVYRTFYPTDLENNYGVLIIKISLME